MTWKGLNKLIFFSPTSFSPPHLILTHPPSPLSPSPTLPSHPSCPVHSNRLLIFHLLTKQPLLLPFTHDISCPLMAAAEQLCSHTHTQRSAVISRMLTFLAIPCHFYLNKSESWRVKVVAIFYLIFIKFLHSHHLVSVLDSGQLFPCKPLTLLLQTSPCYLVNQEACCFL